jgi:hypothetical protein
MSEKKKRTPTAEAFSIVPDSLQGAEYQYHGACSWKQ